LGQGNREQGTGNREQEQEEEEEEEEEEEQEESFGRFYFSSHTFKFFGSPT
jgi:hypothetical protein